MFNRHPPKTGSTEYVWPPNLGPLGGSFGRLIGPPYLAGRWAPPMPSPVILGPRLRALLWQAEYIPQRFHIPMDLSGTL